MGDNKNNCVVQIAYKPIIVRGLIYKTITVRGLHQTMATDYQQAKDRINKLIKYYDDQHKSQLEANRATAKRLVVPSDEFLGWMKNGCMDNDTFLVLRNCVLKKSYHKKIALKNDFDEAKKILSLVGVGNFQLMSQTFEPHCVAEDTDLEFPWTQGVVGLIFGVTAAKIFCFGLFRFIYPN